ncbi:MAG TPA: hypothetical protein VK698_37310 [Kofleriaceae bacterium]|nr:hypothetical protein [Kofleriaceae bacterium]
MRRPPPHRSPRAAALNAATAATALVAAMIVVLAAPPAAAHVAPSERDNNRYLLVAPLADRVRLAYTVYMGQEPGRRARPRMDTDHDGAISEAEASAYGRQLAAQVLPHLSLEVDGQPVAIEWQDIDVGLGEPSVSGGAFAVDLVAWICLDRPRERLSHRVRLHDRFHIPDPGETELRAEESPGLRITRSDLGGPESARPSVVRLDFRWMGGPGPAESQGYLMEFEVDPSLATFDGGECTGASGAGPGGPGRRGWLLGGAALAALALGTLAVRRLRR